jgi:hypothetical protein
LFYLFVHEQDLGDYGFFLWEERSSRGGASKEEAEEEEPRKGRG